MLTKLIYIIVTTCSYTVHSAIAMHPSTNGIIIEIETLMEMSSELWVVVVIDTNIKVIGVDIALVKLNTL